MNIYKYSYHFIFGQNSFGKIVCFGCTGTEDRNNEGDKDDLTQQKWVEISE